MATTFTGEERRAARRERERRQAQRAPRSGFWQRLKSQFATLAAFWTKINNDGLFNMAAMLAYNFLMSAFPILLVLFTIGGLILTATGAGQQVLVNAVGSALPSGTAQNLLVHI